MPQLKEGKEGEAQPQSMHTSPPDEEEGEGKEGDQRAVQNGGQELFIEYDDGDKMWHSTNETRIVEIATEDAPEVSPSARSEHAPQLND